MNKILIGAVAFALITFNAKADTVNGYIQDHYKSVVQQTGLSGCVHTEQTWSR